MRVRKNNSDTQGHNAVGRAAALRLVVLILACVLLVFAAVTAIVCFSGCGGSGKPAPTEAPEPTEQAAYETEHIIRYWPEDADYSTCDYACIMDKPVFSRTQTAGAAMNKAVEGYFEELFERIEKEYTPAAVADPPYTEVKCEVERCGEYINVIFTEEHCYEAQPIKTTRVLILDERGEEVNANDVYRTYHADEYIAEALLEQMRSEDRFYNDIVLNDVLAKLDIARGCVVESDGCTVFLPEGVFAPYHYGELSLKVNRERIAPDFVGSVMGLEEYLSAAELADAVASACIVREVNVERGELTPYAATAFMGALTLRSERTPDKGRITVPQAEFEAIYKACFGTEFPGIDTDGFDIRLEEGNYSVSASQKVYEYHIDFKSAERQGSDMVLTGDLIFGAFGYPFSTPVCHVTVRLTQNSDSPYGYTLDDYTMSL